MAPRTKEQQEAYNAKRRAETAAKKAAKSVQVVKPERLAGKVNAERAPKAKNTSKPKRVKHASKEILSEDRRSKPKNTSKAMREAKAKRMEKVKGTIPAHVKDLGPGKGVVIVPPEPKPVRTMALSYLRNGAPGGGMQRGKNFQTTVTFTPEQFMELRDKADFNQRSLAEQIRWCCIQQLKMT